MSGGRHLCSKVAQMQLQEKMSCRKVQSLKLFGCKFVTSMFWFTTYLLWSKGCKMGEASERMLVRDEEKLPLGRAVLDRAEPGRSVFDRAMPG